MLHWQLERGGRPCCRRSAALNHDLSDPSLAPASFGPFRVLHQIGVGVLGPVYRAQDGVRDQLVAVKVFKVDAPPEQAEQIAEALQAVVQALPRHHGLIELIAAGVERDTAYLVMTHSDVLSLDTRLKPGVPLGAEEALDIIRTLAEAMDAAHARGIVHGGLHPRDVFVDERGGCRAAGFGVATALARAGVRVPVRRPYSPPERLTSAPIEPTADRFALGAIAFELLSGRRIVGTGTAAAARCSAPVPDADLDKLQNALAAMLAEQPAHRPSTATAFAQALTQALFPRGLAHGVGLGATLAADRDRSPAANARDDRHLGASTAAGAAIGAGAGFAMPPNDPDGPSPDDLERFARQGTLWEANGVTRDAAGERLRWETVESVAEGEDPLTLFAPESPSPSAGAADGGAGATAASADTADDSPGSSESGVTTRPDSILGLSSLPATSPAFITDPDRVDDVDVDDEEIDEPADARANATTQGAPREREPGVAPPFLRAERDEVAEPGAAREPGFAPPYLRVDRDELAESDALAAEGPSVFDDEPTVDRTPELPIAAANVAAAAGVERPRIDHEAAERAAAVNAWNRVPGDEDRDASDDQDEYDPVRERETKSVAPPVFFPPANRPAAAAASPTSTLVNPEPADVGSPVRVIGLVLALGLAVGGAGGYLLGQRSALRGPSSIERAESEGAAPPGAASDAGRAGAAGTPGVLDPRASGSSAAPDRGTSGARGESAGRTAAAATPGATAAGRAANDANASRAGASTGRLTITSSPSYAEVAIDGVRRGATPLTVRDLPFGSHTVRVTRTGFAPETRRVTLGAASASSALTFELEPTGRRPPPSPASPSAAPAAATDATPPVRGSASGLGSLYIVSRPMGAQVKVDGRVVGATPLLVTDVSTGAHTVQIEAPGHKPWSSSVQVTAGQRIRVGASLEEGSQE